ncbi:hypothetical protein P3S68_020329 [Capsicum galapagoense]
MDFIPDNVEEGDFITIEIDGNVQSTEVVVKESNRVSNNPINARKEEPIEIMEEPETSKTKVELAYSVDEKFYDRIQFLESTSATVTTVVEEIKTMEKKKRIYELS